MHFSTSDIHLIKLQSYFWVSEYIHSHELNMYVKVNSPKIILFFSRVKKSARNLFVWTVCSKPRFSLLNYFIIIVLYTHRSTSHDMFLNDPHVFLIFYVFSWRPEVSFLNPLCSSQWLLQWGHVNVLMREVIGVQCSCLVCYFSQNVISFLSIQP